MVNKKSGVAGISGLSSDMRDIEAGVAAKNERAILALQMYEYRITKYIGAYAAALGGVDIIVFTGGVGENQTITREAVCKPLAFKHPGIKSKSSRHSHRRRIHDCFGYKSRSVRQNEIISYTYMSRKGVRIVRLFYFPDSRLIWEF